MKLIDYRNALGLGFSDKQKTVALRNKMFAFITNARAMSGYVPSDLYKFCYTAGLEYPQSGNAIYKLANLITEQKSIAEMIYLFSAAGYTREVNSAERPAFLKLWIDILKQMLDETMISYDILQDEDGWFVFPKGATKFDSALISEPFMWLSKFPQAHKTFCIALKQYSDSVFIRDTADNFRKALEAFLQEFFGNRKNLDNNIKEVGNYIKQNGGENEITAILVGLMNAYNTLNNKVAKHDDKVDKRFLEFLMYQTGLFIRMLIVLKQSETPQEDA